MTPMFTMALFICVLFCGLALDIGMVELQRSQMQTAADAAAIADEMQFERGGSATGVDDGLAAAAALGFTNGVNNTTVTNLTSPLNNAPSNMYNPVPNTTAVSYGDYNGHYDTIQVLIQRKVKTLFLGLANGGSITIGATGVASPPVAEFYLGTKNLTTPTVNLSNLWGSPAISSTGPVYINGGLWANGNWWGAYQTYVTGSSGGSTGGQIHSGETFNAPVRSDPLASMTQPTAGACNYLAYTNGSLLGLNTNLTLYPGTYCGTSILGIVTPGLTLLNQTVTLMPGLYVITGGMTLLKTTLTGNGVTLFFTKVNGSTSYGKVLISGLSTINLKAYAAAGSTFGVASVASNYALPGVLFFLDRNWVNTTAQDFDMDSSGLTFNGVFYMPSTGLAAYNGGWGCNGLCGIVADNLWVSNIDRYELPGNYSVFTGGNPFRQNAALVQ